MNKGINIYLGKLSIIYILCTVNMLWWKYMVVLLPLLLSIAFFTLLERKVLAGAQRRRGPNAMGPYGLFQPVSDGLKLFGKENIIPNFSNIGIFIIIPVLFFIISLLNWAVIPYDKYSILTNIELSVFFLLAISSLTTYGIIMAGWASNSKYAFLGCMRTISQLISYEISIGLLISPVFLFTNSTNLHTIVEAQQDIYFVFPLFPAFVLFIISILAETNRIPFDLSESESELVSGYNTEFSSIGFVLFFLAEYSNIILMASLLVCLFLGGYLPPIKGNFFLQIPGWFWFASKTVFIVFFLIWVRATLPRYRYDQLMFLGWKLILPASLLIVGYSVLIINIIL